jgi:hypothetical protein
MSLRIAFDLDGVLADMESELIRQAEGVFGEPMTRKLRERGDDHGPQLDTKQTTDDTPEAPATDTLSGTTPPLVKLDMTSRQQRRLWHHVGTIENFWESLEEIEPGVIARLAGIVAEHRWEIIFLTKRPQTAGVTAQLQSQRWLQSKGYPLPSVYVVQGSRGRIAAALGLDIVIDDRPENCLDVVTDSKARAVLVSRDVAEALPSAARRLGIGVVRSVNECLDILTTVEAQRESQDTNVLSRIKRMLGLTQTTDAERRSH